MLSGHGSIAMAVQAIQKGALDFLEKPVDGDKLQQLFERAKVQTAQNQQRNIDRQSLESKLATLTPREYELMERYWRGNSIK